MSSPTSNLRLDEEGLRLFAEWLGMNYGKKVFGDQLPHHARRIFSHATSVISSRRNADETTGVTAHTMAQQAGSWFDRKDLTLNQRETEVAALFKRFARQHSPEEPSGA